MRASDVYRVVAKPGGGKPTISFEKVRVSDTQAAVGAPLFRADEFTVWLSVSPLPGPLARLRPVR